MGASDFHWSIKYAASAGVGILSAVVATIAPTEWQFWAAGLALILLGYAGIGAAWHLWRHRKGRGASSKRPAGTSDLIALINSITTYASGKRLVFHQKVADAGFHKDVGILRTSTHPIWIDGEMAALRDGFLRAVAEAYEDRAKGEWLSADISGARYSILTMLAGELVDALNHWQALPDGQRVAVSASADASQAVPHALEITFDPQNSGRKFWSMEAAPPAVGETKARPYWEYRALVRNISSKTVKNVKAVVEAIGPMPTRPELSYFDIDKQPVRDLAPGEGSLVVIRRWPIPVKAVGFLVGDGYGPIKVTAFGDDVRATSKLFRFAYEETPMISELPVTTATPATPSPQGTEPETRL